MPHVFPAQAIEPGQAQKPGGPDNAAEGKEGRERQDIGQHHFSSTPRLRVKNFPASLRSIDNNRKAYARSKKAIERSALNGREYLIK
ncbi:MAG: hypothetical protein ACREIE_08075 [Nitrospiraceae bacterium]